MDKLKNKVLLLGTEGSGFSDESKNLPDFLSQLYGCIKRRLVNE